MTKNAHWPPITSRNIPCTVFHPLTIVRGGFILRYHGIHEECLVIHHSPGITI